MHSRFLTRAHGVLLLAAGTGGCAGPQPLGELEQSVIGGEPAGDERASVVYAVSEVSTFQGLPVVKIGSATLVAPNLVATALHVVSRNPSNVPFTCDANGNEVSSSNGSLLGDTVAPEKFAIYEGYTPSAEPVAHGVQIISTGSETLCENDLAFVVLDQAVDLPIVPIYRGPPAQLGEVLTAVGYGSDDPEALPTRSQREVTVTQVGQWIRTFTVSEGPCEGDSGGPTLSAIGELTGVFSSVTVSCTGSNSSAKYTDISFFSKLVEQAFLAADAGSPWPVEGGGAGGAGGAASAGSAGEATQMAGTGSVTHDDGGCTCASVGGSAPRAPWLIAVWGGLWVITRRVVVRRFRAAQRAQVAHESARLV
jgi:hypothetical protein